MPEGVIDHVHVLVHIRLKISETYVWSKPPWSVNSTFMKECAQHYKLSSLLCRGDNSTLNPKNCLIIVLKMMLTGETAWSWYRNSGNRSMTLTQFENCTHSQCCCTRSMSDGNQNGYQLFIKRTHLRLCSSCGQFRTGLCSCVIRVSGWACV